MRRPPPISPRGSPARRRCRKAARRRSSRDQIKDVQQRLQARGFDVGGVDGTLGVQTRAAVKQVQIELGLPADSYPDAAFLSALRRG